MNCKALIDGTWESCRTLGHSQFEGKTYYTVRWGKIVITLDSTKIKFR